MHNEGIGSWPARRARRTPHRTALLHEGRSTSYVEPHRRSGRPAHLPHLRGVRRGDRVAFLGPNHPAFLEALFAAGRVGAVFVPLNTRLAAPELRYQLRGCGSGDLLTVHQGADPLKGLAQESEVWEVEGEEFEALLAHLDGRPARYKTPRSVRFTDALPRGGTGRLLKGPIRSAHGQG
ncbi:AMP-binding protein [Kitasatospora misakiensis]|uniref:AMP-binding protein n=1 Tax=Kitasatospora misakiensis TaxID=67330 RepID=A0ABW0X1V0_9ACTN